MVCNSKFNSTKCYRLFLFCTRFSICKRMEFSLGKENTPITRNKLFQVMSIAFNGILFQFLNKFSIGIQKRGQKTRWNTERYCEWHLLQQFQYFRWISEILLCKYAWLVYCMSWIIIIFPNKIRNLCFMCLVRVQHDMTRSASVCIRSRCGGNGICLVCHKMLRELLRQMFHLI